MIHVTTLTSCYHTKLVWDVTKSSLLIIKSINPMKILDLNTTILPTPFFVQFQVGLYGMGFNVAYILHNSNQLQIFS